MASLELLPDKWPSVGPIVVIFTVGNYRPKLPFDLSKFTVTLDFCMNRIDLFITYLQMCDVLMEDP